MHQQECNGGHVKFDIVEGQDFWDSCDYNIPSLPDPKNDRVLIGDETIALNEFSDWNIANEKGWKGAA